MKDLISSDSREQLRMLRGVHPEREERAQHDSLLRVCFTYLRNAALANPYGAHVDHRRLPSRPQARQRVTNRPKPDDTEVKRRA